MARLSPPSFYPLLHHFLRPPPSSSLSPLLSHFLFKPPIPFNSPSSRPFHFPLFHSLSISQPTLEPITPDNYDDEELEIGNEELGFEDEEEEETFRNVEEVDLNSSPPPRAKELLGVKLPILSVKEKKELSSYAHSLGRKLKSQQVGKSGVTESVATALIETLEKNELLKLAEEIWIESLYWRNAAYPSRFFAPKGHCRFKHVFEMLKIHNNCPGELDDVVRHLEKATGSVVVGQIGRTVILYRPSLTKLKAEEKMEQARKVFRRKQLAFKLPSESKGQRPRLTGRGRRGSSRFSSSPS